MSPSGFLCGLNIFSNRNFPFPIFWKGRKGRSRKGGTRRTTRRGITGPITELSTNVNPFHAYFTHLGALTCDTTAASISFVTAQRLSGFATNSNTSPRASWREVDAGSPSAAVSAVSCQVYGAERCKGILVI